MMALAWDLGCSRGTSLERSIERMYGQRLFQAPIAEPLYFGVSVAQSGDWLCRCLACRCSHEVGRTRSTRRVEARARASCTTAVSAPPAGDAAPANWGKKSSSRTCGTWVLNPADACVFDGVDGSRCAAQCVGRGS